MNSALPTSSPKENLPTVEERLQWLEEYQRVNNVSLVCAKFGISRKTFYKWLRRYTSGDHSAESLKNRSRRPHMHPRTTPEHIVQRLKMLREQTGFGQKRLQLYLSLWYDVELAENTIWKLLTKSGVDMKATRGKRRVVKPNEPQYPGDRVTLFVKRFVKPIEKKTYFYYGAVDECTHLRIGRIYRCHSTLSALDFVQCMLTLFPFPVRYIQTPLDNVFTSIASMRSPTHAFTQNLQRLGIKQHIPTTKRAQSQSYSDYLKKLDSNDVFLQHSYSTLTEAEIAVRNYLVDYNNKQPRNELSMRTPLEKIKRFAQFSSLERFEL